MDLKTWIRAEWDRIAGWALVALAAIALVLGFRGIADTPYVVDQLAYLASGAAGGLFLMGLAGTLLVTADLKDEWRKLDRIERLLEEALGQAPDDDPADDDPADDVWSNGEVAGGVGSATRQPSSAGRGRARRLVADATRFRAAPPALERLALPSWATATALVVLGAAVFVIATAVQVAGEDDVGLAMDGAARAGIGVLVGVAACLAFVLLTRQQVRQRSGRILHPLALAGVGLGERVAPVGHGAARLAIPGMTRYHRPGCAALAGADDAQPISADGLEPCALCHR